MIGPDDSPDSDETRGRQQRVPALLSASLLSLCTLSLSGCMATTPQATAPPTESPHAVASASAAVHTPRAIPLALESPPSSLVEAATTEPAPIWERLRRGFALPTDSTPRLARELRRIEAAPHAASALLARSEPYLHYILNEVEKAGLPHELALLPAVESGFRPYAYSSSGAAGLWQFMPTTGHMLGLEQDWWHDRRRSIVDSTAAAITYLQTLYARFDGDWLHALAAYNAGTGTVKRAIARARARGEPTDYWSLDLPRETEGYVPRLLALAAAVRAPESFAVHLPDIADAPRFAVLDAGEQIDLAVLADRAEIALDDLLALNPAQRRWASHPDGPHRIVVPIEAAERTSDTLAALPPEERLRWRRHQIRQGDSLIRIAREYGVTVDALRRANGLSGSNIRAGKDLMIPLADSVEPFTLHVASAPRQQLHYRVRRGDSLYRIAEQLRVSVADLRRWNSVGRYLQPGERLTLFVDPDA
jgi:membrane-bound lytic murein transglycosylase D